MKIVHLLSEVAPFAKVGGLGDVGGALPKALADLGHDVRVIMPLYGQVDRRRHRVRPTPLRVSLASGATRRTARVWQTTLPGSRVCVALIHEPWYFNRQHVYGPGGGDYRDSLARFSFFCQAALRLLGRWSWQPQVIHCHDWPTALACAALAGPSASRRLGLRAPATVFTIHNLSYQGEFPRAQGRVTSLAAPVVRTIERDGAVNCLLGGLRFADLLTTVSPTYAKEIQTRRFGCGFDRLLRARRGRLLGIVNGIDPRVWDPSRDPHLAARYSATRPSGKARCKRALQRSQGLPVQGELVVGMVQRLAAQKGIDLVLRAMDRLLALPVQLVVLGAGDRRYARALRHWARRARGRLAVTIGFDEGLAHRIEAGADAFLMPSRFEPCGLNQLYSMRYGTVPIVRRVGGLADTVVDATPSTLARGTATGIVFGPPTARALVAAVTRAARLFEDAERWHRLQAAGMRQDFSWRRSARRYEGAYRRAIRLRGG